MALALSEDFWEFMNTTMKRSICATMGELKMVLGPPVKIYASVGQISL